jgi:Fur family transcriptional regulator, zinc uptake regulator
MTEKAPRRKPAPEQDRIIEAALRAAGRPVSAYELIDRVRGDVSLAPQTVYRALDRLITAGAAHRLESLNAFVACTHTAHSGTALFAICDQCGDVREFDETEAVKALSRWASKTGFKTRQMTLELRGLCAACGRSE